jgi:hypothetical protein
MQYITFQKIFILWVIVLMPISGQAYGCKDISQPLKDETNNPFIYITKKSDVPVYLNSTGHSTVGKTSPFGELYFGKTEKEGRIQVGKWQQLNDCFTSIVGWIAKSDLLIGRKPIRVYQAVEKGLKINSTANDGEKNYLYFKILTKPEIDFKPRAKPNGNELPEKSEGKFIWHYVYDIEKVDDRLWYLGAGSDLSKSVRFVQATKPTIQAEVRKHLLGWIPEKVGYQEIVIPWVSNVVMEYNSAPDAVAERLGKGFCPFTIVGQQGCPAVMYEIMSESSSIKAFEMVNQLWPPKEFWSFAEGYRNYFTNVDPIGIEAQWPRYHVIEQMDNDWLHVATLDSFKFKSEISQVKIAHLMTQIDELYASLEEVDTLVKRKVRVLLSNIIDELAKHSKVTLHPKVALLEGYIKEQYSYHKYPTFRRRVMVEEDELVGLKAVAKDFIDALQNALDNIKTQKQDPQELIGQAMLYAIATVEGDYDVMDELDSLKTRGQAINQWWKTGKTSNETIADLINAPKFLPFSKTGIFGVTREELKDWSFDDLKNQTNQSYQKVKCMELVIADKTVPNEFGTCLTYEGKTKRWAYKPPNSDSKYIYLPEWMIP